MNRQTFLDSRISKIKFWNPKLQTNQYFDLFDNQGGQLYNICLSKK